MSELSSTLNEFGRSLWGKVIGALTIIMMLIGIYVELVGAWRATFDARKAAADAQAAEGAVVNTGKKAEILEKQEADEVRAALHAGRYADAYRLAHMYFGSDIIGQGPVLLSWVALFDHKYAEALSAAGSYPSDLAVQANRAHALMLLGRGAEAKASYLAHKDETMSGKPWAQVISEDFAELRKAGITHPMMAEIETALKAAP